MLYQFNFLKLDSKNLSSNLKMQHKRSYSNVKMIAYSDINFTEILFDTNTPKKSCYNYIIVVHIYHVDILNFLCISSNWI